MALIDSVLRVGRRILAGSDAALTARRRTGKGLVAQARELARLRWGPTRLSIREYYANRLYDDDLYPGRTKEEVGGGRLAVLLSRSLNDLGWFALARDKLLFDAFARALGLPTPRVVALYHGGARTYGDVPSLRTGADVTSFLRRCDSYPLFGKRVDKGLGRNATSIDDFDSARDQLRLGNGELVDLRGFVDARVVPLSAGYLFQERMEPHPALLDSCGPRLTSLRLTVLSDAAGPRVFRASWKVPTGTNVTDNYHYGRSGNLLARLDPETGKVLRVVRGTAWKTRPGRRPAREAEDVTRHPDTGRPLVGLTLPDWERAVAVTLSAHSALSGLRWLGWDVALARDGPVLLECNHRPDIPQFPGGRGAYDAELRAFARRHPGG